MRLDMRLYNRVSSTIIGILVTSSGGLWAVNDMVTSPG